MTDTSTATAAAAEGLCANCQAIRDSTKLSGRQRLLLNQAMAYAHVPSNTCGPGPCSSTMPGSLPAIHLDRTDPKIREVSDEMDRCWRLISPHQDIIRMIMQYLQDEGYQASRMTLHDEANLKWREYEDQVLDMKRIRKAILDGEWAEVDRIITSKPFLRNHKGFLYAVYKQQYLEYIEHHEFQKAFNFLNKRLKPLEAIQPTSSEFKDLCYLLTCKSIQDTPSFANWDGITSTRERLVDQLQNMIHFETLADDRTGSVPPDRLLTLLQQSAGYQVATSRYHPRQTPHVQTLLFDYQPFVVPNACERVLKGHRLNVKCVCWVGQEGRLLASGGSDNTVRVWDAEKEDDAVFVLEGHGSRVWNLTSDRKGSMLLSAGGDGNIKVWNLRPNSAECTATLRDHVGDVYSVQLHPSEKHVGSGGYDKTVRLFDLQRATAVQTFTRHELTVSSVIFNPVGSLLISGSKDNTIRFWDVNSGLCIKTIDSHLGEVTSVEMNCNGTLLLSSSKDNSVRLWDIRMIRPIRKFKGHQNTSKNFIRAGFASDRLIVSGSEDGMVHIWDPETAEVLQRLSDHQSTVYSAVWNRHQCRLASCSDDRTVRVWWFDPEMPLYKLDQERIEMARDETRQQERIIGSAEKESGHGSNSLVA